MKFDKNVKQQRSYKLGQSQAEGPNWILIVGGALLSTLSIKFGCLLKQAFDTKQSKASTCSGNGKFMPRRMSEVCQLHSNLYCFDQGEEGCYYCHTGMSGGPVDFKQAPASPASKEGDVDLPLVAISSLENGGNRGVIWPSSPECLELPRKPFNNSSSSESVCLSECGSDVFSKREVILKLREQLKKRDEMILEMQSQIAIIKNSLTAQMTRSAHLQSQLDGANKCLLDSELEIQRLRKAIANHCMADTGIPKKAMTSQNWHAHVGNGHANDYANGYVSSGIDVELNYVVSDNGRDSERLEMMKHEVKELKEVIEGKEFLIQSYREQKTELCTKVKELQLRLAPQVPNIL